MPIDALVGAPSFSLEPALRQINADIDRLFEELLASPPDSRGPLYDAMRYAAIGGGKRLRPLLVEHSRAKRGTDVLRRLSEDIDAICELLGLNAGKD